MARHRQHGLTLIELLVTLTSMTVLSVAATSLLPGFIQQNRIAAAFNDIVAAIHLARSEAIMRRRQVVLCPSTDGRTCGNSADWPQGWLLFASHDRERDPDEPLLRVGNPLGPGIHLRSGNYRKRIAWQANGSSPGANSSFTFCGSNRRVNPRVLCLSNSGRVRLSHTRCDGRPVNCP